jgi:RNA polymerase sigma-70 factor, ECF subfamily
MNPAFTGHNTGVLLGLAADPQNALERVSHSIAPSEAETRARITTSVRTHYGFVWRSLRRFGIPESDVDDACQKVMEVFANRCAEIAQGKERAFMFQVALRVFADARKAKSRARVSADEDRVGRSVSTAPSPEEELTHKQARALLDRVLDALEPDLRVVFVLFEIEEISTQEIAELVQIPPGTVSSRLGRARSEFEQISKRIRAQQARTP